VNITASPIAPAVIIYVKTFKTDVIVNITASPIAPAVIIYVKTFKTDVIVFFSVFFISVFDITV
jgi:Flp pilus assembly pilin Flp